jgi:hypothetical protein
MNMADSTLQTLWPTADTRSVTGAFGWDRFGRYVAALGACGLIGWVAFAQGAEVPVLGLFDFGIHELGHLLTIWMAPIVMFMAGSALQILVPLGLAMYFAFRRRDPVAAAVTLAWAGTSAHDVSTYIADAPFQRLPLVFPGSQHDWAYILGPRGFDSLDAAATIALTVKATGAALVVGTMAMLLVLAIREQLGLEAAPGEVRRNLTIRRPKRWAPQPPTDQPAHSTTGGSQ